MIRSLGRGVAGAALLIGVVTVAARLAGFGRYVVFSRTVETNCLATAYFTANQVPNIVFEIVVGGALAGMVVPVIAGAAARAEHDPDARAEVSRSVSALITWVLLLLVPLSVLTAVLAGPLIELLVGGDVRDCATGDVVAAATRMLVVFAPQIPLYGLAVVLYGLLQAHRRFFGPAVAPLVSSLVVMTAYAAFVPVSGGERDLTQVPDAAVLVLAVGTTLGVAALVVTVLGPAGRLRLRLRPTLRFPEGVAGQVRALALAGLAALVAQQIAMAVAVRLANDHVGAGAIAAYNYAWAVYQVPYAVLAVPIATSVFPVLSARAREADGAGFAAMAADTTRAVVLVSGLAAGALAAVALPVARVFLAGTDTTVAESEFAAAVALFAPGLLGYGLVAHLSRVLYADGRGRAAATGTVVGWSVVIIAQIAFVVLADPGRRLGALALGSAVGMTVGGALLLAAVHRGRGRAALQGTGRAALAAVAGGAAAVLAGGGVTLLVEVPGLWPNVAMTLVAGAVAVVAGGLVAAVLDRPDTRLLLDRLARRGVRAAAPAGGPPGGGPGDGPGDGPGHGPARTAEDDVSGGGADGGGPAGTPGGGVAGGAAGGGGATRQAGGGEAGGGTVAGASDAGPGVRRRDGKGG